jgi:hypothetical protein
MGNKRTSFIALPDETLVLIDVGVPTTNFIDVLSNGESETASDSAVHKAFT